MTVDEREEGMKKGSKARIIMERSSDGTTILLLRKGKPPIVAEAGDSFEVTFEEDKGPGTIKGLTIQVEPSCFSQNPGTSLERVQGEKDE